MNYNQIRMVQLYAVNIKVAEDKFAWTPSPLEVALPYAANLNRLLLGFTCIVQIIKRRTEYSLIHDTFYSAK